MSRSSDSNFLIALVKDKTFQASEIRRVVTLTFVYLVVTTVLVGIFYHQMLGRLLDGMAPLLFVSEDMALANEALPSMASVLGKWLTVMLVVNALITVSLGIYITRKLGHPILAIKRSLREIGKGNLDVRLREEDNKEFGEIVKELSSAMSSIREQIKAAKSGIEKAGATALDDTNTVDRAQAIDACRDALDFFQVDGGNAAKSSKAA